MNEMINRLVQAMHAELSKPAYAGYLYTGELRDGTALIDGDVDFEQLARVVVEAMREPTDEMMVNAEAKMPALACFHEKKRSPSYLAWQAMIDAALKP